MEAKRVVRYTANLTEVLIRLGQDPHASGLRSCNCPFALAMTAALPEGEYASCSSEGGTIYREVDGRPDDGGSIIGGIRVPREVSDSILAMDGFAGRPDESVAYLRPFTFEFTVTYHN